MVVQQQLPDNIKICEESTSQYGTDRVCFAYTVCGVFDKETAQSLAYIELVNTHGNFYTACGLPNVPPKILNYITVETSESIGAKDQNQWRFVFCYQSRPAICQPGDFTMSFGVRTEVQTLARSYAARRCDGSNEDNEPEWTQHPDGLLFTKNCKPKGCEVIIPQKEFKQKICLSNATMTPQWCFALSQFVGTTNFGSYGPWPNCSLLVTGISGSQDADFNNPLEITICMSFSPPVERKVLLANGKTCTVQKLGWEKVWYPSYHRSFNQKTGICESLPNAVEVHSVYEKKSFVGLTALTGGI